MSTNMRYGQYQHVVQTLPSGGIKRHEDVALVNKEPLHFGRVLANMEELKHRRTGKGSEYLVKTKI